MSQPWPLLLCCLMVANSPRELRGQGTEPELRTLFERAEQAQQQGDLNAAAGELRKAIRLAPDHAEAHARMGMLYRHLGKPVEAIRELERSLQIEANPRLRALLALGYADAGRYREAISILAPSFESEQKNALRAAIGQRLLDCYLGTGDNESALKVAQELRRIAPDDAQVLYLASKVYMNLWNGAYEQMVARHPESYQVRLITAEALEAQERFGEAAGEYRQILKLAPRLPGIHYRLAQAIARSDSAAEAEQKALQELGQELEINPADVRAMALGGEIYLRGTRLDEASQSFTQALSLQPDFVPARIGLAKVLIARRQWDKALENLEAARKLAPADETVAYNLMLAYRGLGRADEARRSLDEFRHLQQRNQRNRSPLSRTAPPQ